MADFESKLNKTEKHEKYLRSAIRNGRGENGINDQNLLASVKMYQSEQVDQFLFLHQFYMTKSDQSDQGVKLNEWIELWRSKNRPVVFRLSQMDLDVPKRIEIDNESFFVNISTNTKEVHSFDLSNDEWTDKPDEHVYLLKTAKYLSLHIYKADKPDEFFQLQSIVRHAFLNTVRRDGTLPSWKMKC